MRKTSLCKNSGVRIKMLFVYVCFPPTRKLCLLRRQLLLVLHPLSLLGEEEEEEEKQFASIDSPNKVGKGHKHGQAVSLPLVTPPLPR